MRQLRLLKIKVHQKTHVKHCLYYVIASVQILFILTSGGVVKAANFNCSDPTKCLSKSNLFRLNNNTAWYDPTVNFCDANTTSVSSLVGSNPLQKIYNFFAGNGFTNIQAAAITGNIDDESSGNPLIMENGGVSKNPVNADPNGWGIVQWTPGSKVIGIAKQLNITTPIYTLSTQLEIVLAEMNGTAPTGYQDVTKGLKQINSLTAAVSFFQHNFESGVDGNRQQDAQAIFKLYGNSSGNSGTTTASAICSTGPGSCTNGSGVSSVDVQQIRQNVVACAEQELALWESKKGYPDHTSFAATGYLKYTDGWYELWCADFVSWIYKQAGYPFSGGQAGGWMLAGVSSIQTLGQQNGKFSWHSAGSGYIPKPGDIAIYGNQHTNLFISSSGGSSKFIGGDQGLFTTYGHVPPLPPGSPAPSPPSQSIVSGGSASNYGYYNGVTGYVSPN